MTETWREASDLAHCGEAYRVGGDSRLRLMWNRYVGLYGLLERNTPVLSRGTFK